MTHLDFVIALPEIVLLAGACALMLADLRFGGAGLATLSTMVIVREGQEIPVRLSPLRGIDVRLVMITERELLNYEVVHVDAVTPLGIRRADIASYDMHPIVDGYVANVCLPTNTTELVLLTEQKNARPMQGSRVVAEGELDAAARIARLEVELHKAPR